MRSISLRDSVADSLFPKARQAILGLLYGQPDRAFYLREIVQLTGLGIGHVQRELERLSRGEIIQRSRQGRHVYFKAYERCPIFEELRGLVTKTVGCLDILRNALAPLSSSITAAFVFGSVARGEERNKSDLDLMVIGDVSFTAVVEAVRNAESALRREINPTLYPPGEFRAKLAAGHHFLVSVLKGEKIFVLGDDHELGNLLQERLDSDA